MQYANIKLKTQINLGILAVWSGPLLFAALIPIVAISVIRRLAQGAGWFES